MFKFRTRQTVSKAINKVQNMVVDQALKAGALELGGLISDEADKGRGLTGGFKSYSSKYARYREKKGRMSKPDLQFSGEMMRSVINPELKLKKRKGYKVIEVKLSGRKHTNSSLTIEELAVIQHQRRPFFGVTRRYEHIINKVIIEELSRIYAKLNVN